MAYKIEHESDTIHVIRPEHWWNKVTFKDLVDALRGLGDVVAVVRYWDLWESKYVVITRAQK